MPPPPEGLVESARGAILDLVGERADDGTTGLQPSIFDAYRSLTGDPDEHLATWLREGAPLGINRPVLSSGVFPTVPDEPVSSDYVTGLARSLAGWENYRSADEDAPTATSSPSSALSAGGPPTIVLSSSGKLLDALRNGTTSHI